MLHLFALAWRNIWRNRIRTLLTAGAITFTTAILTFFISLQLSSYSAAIIATTSIFQGQIQIQHQEYFKRPQIYHTVGELESLVRSVESRDEVEVAASRAMSFALFSSEERTLGAQVVGVSPEKEKILSSLTGLVREGEYLTNESGNEIVLGRALAKNLKVSIGDELTMLGQGRDGSMAADVLVVRGIFESGSPPLDRHLIQIGIRRFQETFSMNGDVHSVALKTQEYRGK